MIWITGLFFFILLLTIALLLTAFEIELDTRELKCSVTWGYIGNIDIYFKNKWWLKFKFLIFEKRMALQATINEEKKQKKSGHPKNRRSGFNSKFGIKKIIKLIKTCKVLDWKLAVDTGDVIANARLYAMYALPGTQGHLMVNFINQNFVYLRIKNYPISILKSYFLTF